MLLKIGAVLMLVLWVGFIYETYKIIGNLTISIIIQIPVLILVIWVFTQCANSLLNYNTKKAKE